jgi:ribosomal protein L12E/L44/L45/RPP1/RPP2
MIAVGLYFIGAGLILWGAGYFIYKISMDVLKEILDAAQISADFSAITEIIGTLQDNFDDVLNTIQSLQPGPFIALGAGVVDLIVALC